jgi:hypothetical protein
VKTHGSERFAGGRKSRRGGTRRIVERVTSQRVRHLAQARRVPRPAGFFSLTSGCRALPARPRALRRHGGANPAPQPRAIADCPRRDRLDAHTPSRARTGAGVTPSLDPVGSCHKLRPYRESSLAGFGSASVSGFYSQGSMKCWCSRSSDRRALCTRGASHRASHLGASILSAAASPDLLTSARRRTARSTSISGSRIMRSLTPAAALCFPP